MNCTRTVQEHHVSSFFIFDGEEEQNLFLSNVKGHSACPLVKLNSLCSWKVIFAIQLCVLPCLFKETLNILPNIFRTIEPLSSIYTDVTLKHQSFLIIPHGSLLGFFYCDKAFLHGGILYTKKIFAFCSKDPLMCPFSTIDACVLGKVIYTHAWISKEKLLTRVKYKFSCPWLWFNFFVYAA